MMIVVIGEGPSLVSRSLFAYYVLRQKFQLKKLFPKEIWNDNNERSLASFWVGPKRRLRRRQRRDGCASAEDSDAIKKRFIFKVHTLWIWTSFD